MTTQTDKSTNETQIESASYASASVAMLDRDTGEIQWLTLYPVTHIRLMNSKALGTHHFCVENGEWIKTMPFVHRSRFHWIVQSFRCTKVDSGE